MKVFNQRRYSAGRLSAGRLSGRRFTEFMDEMIHLFQLVKPKRRSADGARCHAF